MVGADAVVCTGSGRGRERRSQRGVLEVERGLKEADRLRSVSISSNPVRLSSLVPSALSAELQGATVVTQDPGWARSFVSAGFTLSP